MLELSYLLIKLVMAIFYIPFSDVNSNVLILVYYLDIYTVFIILLPPMEDITNVEIMIIKNNLYVYDMSQRDD